MNKFRTLKIYQKHQAHEGKYLTVPKIRLEGKWLKALGFKIGKEIRVKQQKKQLISTLAEKKNEH